MSECIFCKIICNKMTSYTIYEDKIFKVILDKFPSALGHTLIIPKNHIPNIFELDNSTANKLFTLAKQISIAIKKSLSIDGLNILQNNGDIAGQTVNHFHLHIIPRYKNDNIKFLWDTINLKDDDFFKTIKAIKINL